MSSDQPDNPSSRKASIGERLKSAGLGDLPYVKFTRNAPTPAEERRGNVVAGVRSMSEGLRRASEIADAEHVRRQKK